MEKKSKLYIFIAIVFDMEMHLISTHEILEVKVFFNGQYIFRSYDPCPYMVNISMGERKTDVTTFSKTILEKQKTFPCDLHD